MKYSIIIPTYNHLEDYLKPCIESIKKNSNLNNIEIIIVANGCKNNTKEYLEAISVNFLWFDNPIGYTQACNEGIKVAKGEYIVLLNDDTVILGSDWLDILVKPFKENNKVGITGPIKFSWDCGGVQRKAIAFWCAMISKEVFNKLGLLDEIFSPGMGEDGDFCIRAEMEGYGLVQVPNDLINEFGKPLFEEHFPIYHKGNGTFSYNTDFKNEAINKNKKILEERYGKKKVNTLDEIYNYCLKHECDINGLFPIFKKYSSMCNHITEFGTRGVFSTYGFLSGRSKKMLSYDIEYSPNVEEAKEVAKKEGIDFIFKQENVLKVDIEQTDLLFIDTLHTYKQLSEELTKHANKVNKYILLHDTLTWGTKDEINQNSEKNGLQLALKEFLDKNSEWKIIENLDIYNGLTVLERISEIEISIIIPTYNHLEDCLKPCIESVIKYTNFSNIEIIVVANGCIDNTKEYVENLGSPFKLVWIDKAIGFTKATNEGIKIAKGKYIILLNNDIILLDKQCPKNTWINMLRQPFLEDNLVGITGPLKLWDNYSASDTLIFFCVMIKREVFNKIGLLDEIFSPGGGEDIDFSVKAVQAGYKLVQVPSEKKLDFTFTNEGQFPIYHIGEGTFSEKEMPEYSKEIVKRNGLINLKRYNKHVKLNVGSGGINYDGYISVDKYDPRAHLHMDACHLDSIFNENSIEEILASHLFEHISPYDAVRTLSSWLKILKPGGKLIMELPNFEELCKDFLKANKSERYGLLNAIYGTVNTKDSLYPEEITSPHLWGWYPEMLGDHLVWAGFIDIIFKPEQIPHPHKNMRVEARKP
jgi:GT2 family glycosyltransferase